MDRDTIKKELSLFEEEYIKYKNLRIYCGTFNVNGRQPDEGLSPWLILNADDIDIYAIGFQELVDLTTTNLLIKNDINEQLWQNSIETELLNSKNFKSKSNYHLLCKIRMFGLFLIIYVKEKLIEKRVITEIFKSQVATGIMDMVGNKGSLGISFKLYESRVCFVCSHFAADTDKLEKRNSDFNSARTKLNFQNENNNYTLSLDDHETVFWFGDLNYRLDKLTLTKTFKLITSQDYEELLKYDQLNLSKNNLKIFKNYNEGRINFKPTYKFITKTDEYEKQALITNLDQEDNFGKVKLPSWTDRVLWRSNKCTLIQYASINTLTISDHKPVYALFNLQVKKIDEKKYQKLYENVLKESDRRINELMPHIELEKFDFNFGQCYFYDVKTKEMIVRNKGISRSNVDIIFYENLQEIACKPNTNQWVSFMPQHKERLEPNTEYKVELRTSFNYKMLPKLIKLKKLDDFLIVRCLNGNDSFATITCEYKPTIIGFSLKGLSTLKDSFEDTDSKLLEDLENKIKNYEIKMDEEFKTNLTNTSNMHQFEKLDRLSISSESPMVLDSKIEIYKATFLALKDSLINDEYFNNDLSVEYQFLMDYLIRRCQVDRTSSNGSEISLSIEEQKNLALVNLSKKNFLDFENFNFDLELLAELLYDLLYSLPMSLIPHRYLDYCCLLATNKTSVKSVKLFEYIPKSHLDLFCLLVKFLRIYLKNLSANESNYSNMIAEAIFQIDKTSEIKTCLNLNAFNFLKLFIDNDKFF
ncbi:unnamed protein product [Brachionus calyciflorus]|uniref:Inositol polyphosphate-related phosphatase domain-containing protein n=1 Tax=Brachionus calyciflorus TaxID=104777 RepID=A0A813YL55_9BILA|nr:unnamed protein product [Brachionus calyciflorus]